MPHGARIAVVTGASSGIGAAVARRLADDEMTVVAVARRVDRLDAMAAAHPRIVAHGADVADRGAVDGLAERVREQFGRCHLLVNNAGVGGGAFTGPESVDGLLRTMQVNFVGAVHTTAALHDLLVESAPSQIINVGPVSGTVGAPSDVAAAVAAAVASPARERTVPRWYRPLMALRHIAPPLFWALASRTSRARGTRVA
jgi:NAD(P)-dependent dehydrogenase (short-subunit alcohol dehydrogenase family)